VGRSFTKKSQEINWRYIMDNILTIEDIKKRIEDGIAGAQVEVVGDGCNCEATVVSGSFEGKSLLAQQREVMATVNDLILSGELHALAIKTSV
jgi:acid stress-induced BolA-like protein IbaG/YrbA